MSLILNIPSLSVVIEGENNEERVREYRSLTNMEFRLVYNLLKHKQAKIKEFSCEFLNACSENSIRVHASKVNAKFGREVIGVEYGVAKLKEVEIAVET